MKQKILISESERRQILSKHLKSGYRTINEQETNYTIGDIQNKLNKDFGSNLVADNKFGPKTSAAIVSALDKVKSGGVTTGSNTATTGSNTATTQTNTSTTGTNTTGTETGTATTTTGTGTATTTGTGTATTTTGSNTGGKEDPSSGD